MVIKASTAVKRLSKEILQLEREKVAEPNAFREYTAAPLEDNLFEWHFTVRGPQGTEFEGGKYHGKILLPQEYPFKPPSIILLTPNGRFSLNKKICLSITGYHPEFWQPAWDIRSVLLAIISMFPTHGDGAIGALDQSESLRRVLAKQSSEWTCLTCGSKNSDALPDPPGGHVHPPRRAGEEGENQAPVPIPGVTFAYEGAKSESSLSPQGAAEERDGGATGSELQGEERDQVPTPCEDGCKPVADAGPNTRAKACPVPETRVDSRESFAGCEKASSRGPVWAQGSSADPGENPGGAHPERPVVAVNPISRAFEQERRQRWRSWAIDIAIAILVCVLAERLGRKLSVVL